LWVLCVVRSKYLRRADHSYRGALQCGMSECDRKASIIRKPWPTSDCCTMGEKYKLKAVIGSHPWNSIWLRLRRAQFHIHRCKVHQLSLMYPLVLVPRLPHCLRWAVNSLQYFSVIFPDHLFLV
jgi:hypothetical protein